MTLPVVAPPFDTTFRPDASVAGVLLAAGASSRFGPANKLLAPLDSGGSGSDSESLDSGSDSVGSESEPSGSAPLVRHAARGLLDAAELDAVAAVVAADDGPVTDALSGMDVSLLVNPDAERGQATSVRRGVRWGREYDAIVFALGDMPRVSPASIDRLVAAYRAGAGDALAAAFDGARGNPVLFDARHFDALADVEGDMGGREILLHGDRSALVETDDPGVLVDVDTTDDLRELR
ncbi:nucleotidyltransferase family protein [Haladaptatus sp. DYF46]|uniref:nucleotidyltransferase family protein n=1 Tax=Haladaptatus sp. DYF46 TaxID=2886041 RepID=UPI001E37E786